VADDNKTPEYSLVSELMVSSARGSPWGVKIQAGNALGVGVIGSVPTIVVRAVSSESLATGL
jgi:hypothetical protein